MIKEAILRDNRGGIATLTCPSQDGVHLQLAVNRNMIEVTVEQLNCMVKAALEPCKLFNEVMSPKEEGKDGKDHD